MATICYVGNDRYSRVWFRKYGSGWREVESPPVSADDQVHIEGSWAPTARYRQGVPGDVYARVPAVCAGCGTAANSSGWRLHLPTLTLWCFRIKDCRRQAHLHLYPDCTDKSHTGYDYDLHDPADAAVWKPGKRESLARRARALKIARWLDGKDLL